MSDQKFETLVIASNIHNDNYRRKVLPRTKQEFFQFDETKLYHKTLEEYFNKYSQLPTKEAMEVEISKQNGITEELHKKLNELNESLFSEKYQDASHKVNMEWMLDKTQEYYRDRAVYNAIMQSMDILDGSNKKVSRGQIPQLMEEALKISFDDGNFHDYFQSAEERYDFFHQPLSRIPFKLKMLNYITKGGLLRKTLNIFVGPTGAGKTMFLCDESQHWLLEGYNVLYVSLEMSEEAISQRIDANLMDLEIDETTAIPKKAFLSKIDKLKQKTTGRLIVKEYPPASLTAQDLSSLLQELKSKHGFVPDIVVLDYINIAASQRYKGSDANTYLTVKGMAEEFRGCAIKHNFCLVTATQTNRGGQGNSDFELTEVSDSHGLSMTADFMIGGIVTEELEKINQMRLKQLKNRYGALIPSSFIIGIERAKMKMFDVDKPSANMDAQVKRRIQEKEQAEGSAELNTPKKQTTLKV